MQKQMCRNKRGNIPGTHAFLPAKAPADTQILNLLRARVAAHLSPRLPPPPPLPPPPLPLPWPAVLRERQLKRGMGFYGSGARVERLVARLQAGQPIVAATLGGSVSWGAGASNRTATSYPARFFQFLNATFPHRRGSPLLPVFAGLLAAFASH